MPRVAHCNFIVFVFRKLLSTLRDKSQPVIPGEGLLCYQRDQKCLITSSITALNQEGGAEKKKEEEYPKKRLQKPCISLYSPRRSRPRMVLVMCIGLRAIAHALPAEKQDLLLTVCGLICSSFVYACWAFPISCNKNGS